MTVQPTDDLSQEDFDAAIATLAGAPASLADVTPIVILADAIVDVLIQLDAGQKLVKEMRYRGLHREADAVELLLVERGEASE